MVTSLKGKNSLPMERICSQWKEFAPNGSKFNPLRVVPYGMENTYHIMWPPLNVYYFIAYVHNCVMGATEMV